MHTRSPSHMRMAPQRLASEVQLWRIRVATGESKLKVLREEARQAKRRRKEAKRIAQRARKQFKRSKADLVELRQALAEAEVKLFKAGGRALARRMAKPKPTRTPRRSAPVSKKPKATARKPRAVFALSRGPRRVTPKPGATKRIDTIPRDRGDGGALDQDQTFIQPNTSVGADSQTYEQEIPERKKQETQNQEV